MEEVWKNVDGYEGLYEVSNQGRVRSLCYHGYRRKDPKVLSPCKDHKGYLLVVLCKDGRQKSFKVHRLVAKAFISNPLNLPQINHKDEGKTNNFVFLDEDGSVVPEKSNLEWCSPTYNINYGSHNARIAKSLSKLVLQYDKSGCLVRKWPSTREVKRQTGWSQSNISKCCHGKRKTAYGFVWRYSDDALPATVQNTLF